MRTVRIVIVLAMFSGALEALEVARLFEGFARGDAQTLRIELATGDLRIWDARDRIVDAELVLGCAGQIEPCRAAAEGMRLDAKRSGDGHLLRLDAGANRFSSGSKKRKRGLPPGAWQLSANLEVAAPRFERLEITIGNGNLVLEQLQGAARIRVGSGVVRLRATRAKIGQVEITVKKGQARLEEIGVRSSDGNKVQWQGPGSDLLEIEVGQGSVVVSLD